MGKYITTYLRAVDAAIEDSNTDFEALKREHLRQIEFIQHERLIHLMVTIMCCILLFLGLIIFFVSRLWAVMAVNGLLLILVFCYLMYYCFIENSTQYMYRQYNRMCKRSEPDSELINKLYENKAMVHQNKF